MSIFLSGNNVASQPYIVKINNNDKPPTDLSLPIGVDYLLPENGGAVIGSIKNISGLQVTLIVTLAGENNLNNQVTYILEPGETLDAQIRYISIASTVDGDPLKDSSQSILMSVSLSSTSTITAPYYNFSAKAGWFNIFGDVPSLSLFQEWLIGFDVEIVSLKDFVVVEHPELDDHGRPLYTISCNLYFRKGKIYLADYFYEISGIGENDGNFRELHIINNNNLKYISSYYGNLEYESLQIANNYELEYIDGNFLDYDNNINITNTIEIYQNLNLKEIINFVTFPSNLLYLNVYENTNYDSNGYTTTNFRWDYDLRNLINIREIQLYNNGFDYFDWSLLPESYSSYSVDLSSNRLTSFSPSIIPNSIFAIYLSGNLISEVKPKVLPANMTTLDLSYNQIQNLEAECDWNGFSLNTFYLVGNQISKLTQSLANIPDVRLENNLLYDWDNYVQNTYYNQTILNLVGNKFTTLPGDLPYPSLSYIYLNNNELTSIDDDLTNYPNLNLLWVQNNKITGTFHLNASSNLTNFEFGYNYFDTFTFQGVYPYLYSLSFNNTNIKNITGDYTGSFINLNGVSVYGCTNLETFNATFNSNFYNIQISESSLTTFNPTCSSLYNLAITNTSLKTFNWAFPINGFFKNYTIANNSLLTSFTTNNLFGNGYLNIFSNKLSTVNLGTGNLFPQQVNLTNNLMTTASWNSMNSWATGLSSSPGKYFYAGGNTNTITGTTTATTLTSKSITIYP